MSKYIISPCIKFMKDKGLTDTQYLKLFVLYSAIYEMTDEELSNFTLSAWGAGGFSPRQYSIDEIHIAKASIIKKKGKRLSPYGCFDIMRHNCFDAIDIPKHICEGCPCSSKYANARKDKEDLILSSMFHKGEVPELFTLELGNNKLNNASNIMKSVLVIEGTGDSSSKIDCIPLNSYILKYMYNTVHMLDMEGMKGVVEAIKRDFRERIAKELTLSNSIGYIEQAIDKELRRIICLDTSPLIERGVAKSIVESLIAPYSYDRNHYIEMVKESTAGALPSTAANLETGEEALSLANSPSSSDSLSGHPAFNESNHSNAEMIEQPITQMHVRREERMPEENSSNSYSVPEWGDSADNSNNTKSNNAFDSSNIVDDPTWSAWMNEVMNHPDEYIPAPPMSSVPAEQPAAAELPRTVVPADTSQDKYRGGSDTLPYNVNQPHISYQSPIDVDGDGFSNKTGSSTAAVCEEADSQKKEKENPLNSLSSPSSAQTGRPAVASENGVTGNGKVSSKKKDKRNEKEDEKITSLHPDLHLLFPDRYEINDELFSKFVNVIGSSAANNSTNEESLYEKNKVISEGIVLDDISNTENPCGSCGSSAATNTVTSSMDTTTNEDLVRTVPETYSSIPFVNEVTEESIIAIERGMHSGATGLLMYYHKRFYFYNVDELGRKELRKLTRKNPIFLSLNAMDMYAFLKEHHVYDTRIIDLKDMYVLTDTKNYKPSTYPELVKLMDKDEMVTIDKDFYLSAMRYYQIMYLHMHDTIEECNLQDKLEDITAVNSAMGYSYDTTEIFDSMRHPYRRNGLFGIRTLCPKSLIPLVEGTFYTYRINSNDEINERFYSKLVRVLVEKESFKLGKTYLLKFSPNGLFLFSREVNNKTDEILQWPCIKYGRELNISKKGIDYSVHRFNLASLADVSQSASVVNGESVPCVTGNAIAPVAFNTEKLQIHGPERETILKSVSNSNNSKAKSSDSAAGVPAEQVKKASENTTKNKLTKKPKTEK